ncbi:MAG: peptidylprolyl isomerase [Gammaproteobacteria bacterium]|nr:peptidylprolyl isomerase [Gammaproteobacteria bacterium]MBT3488578.1 peptidylprolyl isomerase [Gammaproteobacteria bacterium]MBT3718983.1 peptidylprolyl isomerase [Gammaproteobacteria bacterium]MBT3846232.1 peptidylprolyl isomerase [Gammaproteobacteria bacterium]MBT3893977.1 peptidylprolyl isomerase [Gammaproteobacteria bacterium]
MSEATDGSTVKIHYTGTLDDGEQFDSSEGRDPLEFTIGSGQVIPGFDSACRGMGVGDKKTVTLAPEEAYGEHNPEMVAQVERSMMPEDMEPELGLQMHAQGPNGEMINFVIVDFDDENVTVDGNAPLAGKALTFAIEMVEIA